MENKKIKLEKNIFYLTKDSSFRWKDIKHIQFEDEDIIRIEYVEPHHSENNSWYGHFMAQVIRKEEETDEQFQERMKDIERKNKWEKAQRYKNYLNLKEEFEEC